MSKSRYTIEVLASGQPGPYQDTIHHCRIKYEYWVTNNGRGGFVLSGMSNEDRVRSDARHFSGWSEPGDPEHDPVWSTKLVWIKMIEPGVWEWKTQTRFTD